MKLRDVEHRRAKSSSRVSRRSLLKSASLLAAAASGTARADDDDNDNRPRPPILLYVGAYTPNGQGIYLFSMNPSSGKLTQIKVAAAVPSPSWLAIHPQGRYLYAVNEISNFNGTTSGSVSAFSINRANGDLTFLNVVSSQGAGPAHLSVDPLGQYVFCGQLRRRNHSRAPHRNGWLAREGH